MALMIMWFSMLYTLPLFLLFYFINLKKLIHHLVKYDDILYLLFIYDTLSYKVTIDFSKI